MAWLAPGAFAGLILLIGPVIVHLLARRNARRVIFPATHFVRAAPAAAVRPRRPSDIGLLILRLAIVTTAVLAAAQPLVMTRWRLARWNARAARAVLVDTSDVADPGVAARLASQEMQGVFAASRLNVADLNDGIERAVRWIRAAPPSRRDIVIVSDFQRGSLDEETLKAVPADVGIRFIRAGAPPGTRRLTSPQIEGWRGGIWQATAEIDTAGTRTSWLRRGRAEVPRWITVMAGPADAGAADRALRAASASGVPAGDESRRVVVRFAGASASPSGGQAIASAWIASAALTLARSDLLRGVEPGVRVSERDGVMVVDAPVSAADLAAAAIVRAAILAVRPAAIVDAGAEVATIPDADLARWRRDPAPVTTSAIPTAGDSDARWLWALALALLVVEDRARRLHGRAAAREAHADAA
jgi:hypothetical protein